MFFHLMMVISGRDAIVIDTIVNKECQNCEADRITTEQKIDRALDLAKRQQKQSQQSRSRSVSR